MPDRGGEIPPQDALDRAAARAAAWLTANAARFEPRRPGLPFGAARAKPLVELAITLHCAASAWPDAPSAPVVELLRRTCAAPDFRDRRIATRTDVVVDAYLLAALDGHGDADPALRDRLRLAVEARVLEAGERSPHHLMEEKLCLELAGLPGAGPDWQELLDRSIAARLPPPALLGERSAYELTHCVLYLTAFGTRPAVADVGDRAELRATLLALLLVFAAEAHWDLVGELLLCWDALALGAAPTLERAWEGFLAAQDPDGSLPGPRPPARVADQADAATPSPEDRRFGERYHTTLVALVAATAHGRLAATSGRAATPPRRAPAVPIVDVAADRAWLDGLLERLAGQAGGLTPRPACQALVAARALAALDAGCAEWLTGVARRTAAALAAAPGPPPVPPALALVVAGVLADHGHAPPGLSAWVRLAAEALASAPAADPADDLALHEKRLLVHRLGLGPRPTPLPVATLVALLRAAPLDGSRTVVEPLLTAVECATEFGALPVDLGADAGWAGELVAAWAVPALREYDLLTACRALRCAHALGTDGDLAYIAAQQRPHGGFGRFGAQLDGIAAAAGPGFDAERDLQLPVGVACLCLLGERATPWRLHRDLGRLAPP